MALFCSAASFEFLSQNIALITAYPFSMGGWFRISDSSVARTLIFIGDKDDTVYFTDLRTTADNKVMAFSHNYGGASWYVAETSTTFSDATWHHGLGVWASASDRRVYLDGGGKVTNTDTVGAMSGHDRTRIGYLGDSSPDNYLDGSVAEFAVWNVALTDADAIALALRYSPLLVQPQALVHYWPLQDKASTTKDMVGRTNLTWNNTPQVAVHPPIIYPNIPPFEIPAAPLYTTSLLTLQPQQGVPTTSNYALLVTRNSQRILAFDDTTDKSIVFDFVMPQTYSGGGIAAILHSSAATATSGNAKAGVSLERIGDGQQDVDSDGFAGVNNRVFLMPATSGYVKQTRIQFASGADMDSVAVGEKLRLRVTRLASDAADDMTGDWELHMAEVRGT